MAKITRKSYKRKKVVLGVTLFASIALISTGFAAWVIAENANKDINGGIKVGTVEDGSVSFVNVKQSIDNFIFDCKDTDNTGRVYYKNDGNKETLMLTITGAIKNPEYLESFNVKMEVSAGVKAAATAGYIVLPSYVSETAVNIDLGTLTDYTVQENDGKYTTGFKSGDKVKEFSIDVEFKWGEKFGGDNPGIYFDDGDGASKTIEEVTDMMDDFKTTIGESQTYKVTLTAIAKGQSK